MEAENLELEEIIELLVQREDIHLTEGKLYMKGYKPYHQSFRKQVGALGIAYRQVKDIAMFEFAAIYRIP